jgi:hypothetical protein
MSILLFNTLFYNYNLPGKLKEEQMLLTETVNLFWYLLLIVWCNSNADPYYNLAFGPCYTVDWDGTVTHFKFMNHFCGSHCRMMCNCKFEKVFRMLYCDECVSDEWGEEGRRCNPVLALPYSFLKVPREPPDLTSPSNKWITIKSTHAFTSYALRRDLGF